MALMLVGCSDKSPHADKTWISVVSPPNEIRVLCEDDLITQDFIYRVIETSIPLKYQDYTFNPSLSISATGELNKHESDHNSDTSSRTVSVDTKGE